MNMRKKGVNKASKRAHTGLCLSVKEAHFFRLYAQRGNSINPRPITHSSMSMSASRKPNTNLQNYCFT